MVSLVVFLAIVLVLVIAALSKRASGSSGPDRRARLRAQTAYGFQQAQQQFDTSQARPAGAGDVPWPPPPTGPAGGPPPPPAPPSPAAWTPAASWPEDEPRTSDPESADQEDLPAVDEPGTEDGSTVVWPDPATERYVGSAALDSSLDSTIESSLLGMPAGPVTLAALPGGPALSLPGALETEVLALLDDGHEVAAVRLVCDEMDCGILEATRTVRSVT